MSKSNSQNEPKAGSIFVLTLASMAAAAAITSVVISIFKPNSEQKRVRTYYKSNI